MSVTVPPTSARTNSSLVALVRPESRANLAGYVRPADRLRRLEKEGLIVRAAYQERPVRYAYTLSKKGADLGDVLLALVRWGKKHIPGTHTLKELRSGRTR